MTALLAALVAAVGTYLLFTATTFRGRHRTPIPTGRAAGPRLAGLHQWLAQAGLADVSVGAFVAVMGVLGVGGATIGFVLFGAPLPAVGGAIAASCAPVGLYRNRRQARRDQAADEWPLLIEELRLRSTTLGRSVPQALFEVGASTSEELRPAFDAAQREWLISTDFAATLDVLKTRLADSTADLVCEMLLIAHDLGGSDLGRRLSTLAEDRQLDVASRKDARAKQAGVRFARRFVLVVPLGMAAAGSLIGTGRQAYSTALGQLLVLVALMLMALCWVWAGRYLRLPEPQRVFAPTPRTSPVGVRAPRP